MARGFFTLFHPLGLYSFPPRIDTQSDIHSEGLHFPSRL